MRPGLQIGSTKYHRNTNNRGAKAWTETARTELTMSMSLKRRFGSTFPLLAGLTLFALVSCAPMKLGSGFSNAIMSQEDPRIVRDAPPPTCCS